MLDGLISEVLARVLGKYIDDIDDQHIQIGIQKGKVSLQNLHLSHSIFHHFGIPFDARKGIIRNLEIEIPWSNLLSKPLQVRVDGVFIVVQPHAHNLGVNKYISILRSTKNELTPIYLLVETSI